MKWNSTKPVTMDVASTFPVKPTESGTLRILTVNGEEILVSFWASDTVLVLKKRLQELLVDGSSELPCSAMRLIFGTDVLLDNWILGDHGVVDGHQLTLVLSPAPIGLFRNSAPSAASGLGLSASVCASFAQDGSFESLICTGQSDSVDQGQPKLRYVQYSASRLRLRPLHSSRLREGYYALRATTGPDRSINQFVVLLELLHSLKDLHKWKQTPVCREKCPSKRPASSNKDVSLLPQDHYRRDDVLC